MYRLVPPWTAPTLISGSDPPSMINPIPGAAGKDESLTNLVGTIFPIADHNQPSNHAPAQRTHVGVDGKVNSSPQS